MKVYIHLVDTDNSCSDPECCGGPCPSLYVQVFSSIEIAVSHRIKKEDLEEVEVDGEASSLYAN